ncbi:MAG: flagellar basal-body rod protein FlgF [Bdellovibrionales bacterium]|nr:flagellar basal-body rod protein FlgF [Bdellovibrionales bacterium]
MWPSVSGAVARAQAIDTIANNLANANTDGFKKDLPTFKEYLSVLEREKLEADIPRGPIKDKDLHPLDGRDQAFVVNDGTYTDFKQGNLKVTQAPLDIALDGPGFLEVSTPNGVRYTRQGSLKVAMDGRLVTSEGYPVLTAQPGGLAATPAPNVQPGQGGPSTQGGVAVELGAAEIAARTINLRDAGRVSITDQGDVYAGERRVGRLSVVEFSDSNGLRKSGNGLFEVASPSVTATPIRETVVRQGVVEASNVNPAQEMADLIRAQRLFEHDLRAVKTFDSMMDLESNQVGRL